MFSDFRQIDDFHLLPNLASIFVEVSPAVKLFGSKLTLAQLVLAPSGSKRLAQWVLLLRWHLAQCRRRLVCVVLLFAVTLFMFTFCVRSSPSFLVSRVRAHVRLRLLRAHAMVFACCCSC